MTEQEYKAEFDRLIENIVSMKDLGDRGVYVDWFVEKKVNESYEDIKALNETYALSLLESPCFHTSSTFNTELDNVC